LTATATRSLLSLTEAADFGGVTTRTIRSWIAAGHIPGLRLGPRLIRVHRSDLEALVNPIPAATTAARH
jgi:excisionase family DNA binding protein